MIQRVEAGRSLAAGVVSDLGATISEQIARGVTAIHMDASRVVEFDSSSLEALLDFDAKATSRGVSFVLTGPSEVLRTALVITGLDAQLEIGEAVEAAEPIESDGIESTPLTAPVVDIDSGDPVDSVGATDSVPDIGPAHSIEPVVRPEGVDE